MLNFRKSKRHLHNPVDRPRRPPASRIATTSSTGFPENFLLTPKFILGTSDQPFQKGAIAVLSILEGTGVAEEAKAVYIDAASVLAARTSMPGDRMVRALAETFSALSDPTRIRIISALGEQELCVIDLARFLGLTGSAVSHQLRVLRGQRLGK